MENSAQMLVMREASEAWVHRIDGECLGILLNSAVKLTYFKKLNLKQTGMKKDIKKIN